MILIGGLALWNRNDVAAWCDRAGNVATVIGLLVAVVGFALTILTMLDTQRISREAQRRIEAAAKHAEEAVEKAQQDTRQALDKVGTQLRSADCAALRRWLQDLRRAAIVAEWGRAVDRAQDCRWLINRLIFDKHLLPQEEIDLRAGAERLEEIQRFIEKNRPNAGEGSLSGPTFARIDEITRIVEQIEGRLFHKAME